MSLAFWFFLIIWILVSRYIALTAASFSEMSKFESIPRLHPSRNPECPSRFTKGDDNSNDEFLSRPSIEVRAILAPCREIFGKKFHYNFDSERNYEERLHGGIRNCSQKIIISLKFNNVGKTETQEKFVVIDHALDSFTMEKISLRNPYVIKVRQRPVLQLYGLKFQSVVNAEATEEVINNKNPNFKGCNDSDNPTCGRMFVHGKSVPFSEGFCCSCDHRVKLERQTGRVSDDSFESFNDGAKLNYGNGTNKPRNRLQTETAWTNSLDNSMARRQIDVAGIPSKNKSDAAVERHANPDGYRVTKSVSASYNSVGKSPRKEEVKAPRTSNRSKNGDSRVFREEVKFRGPKSVVVEEIPPKKAYLSTKSMRDTSTEAFRENMISGREKLRVATRGMDLRDDFTFRRKDSVKFRENGGGKNQIGKKILENSSIKLRSLTERKHSNLKSNRVEKLSKNGKLVSSNSFSTKNPREGANNKSRRRMAKKILDFSAPRSSGVVSSTVRAPLETRSRKAAFRDGSVGEKGKILGKDPRLESSTENSLLQSNKRKVRKKVFPATLRTYSSKVSTMHLNEPLKNTSIISPIIDEHPTNRKYDRQISTINNINQTTTNCPSKKHFANETMENIKKKKNILKRAPKNKYNFHEPIENRSPRILVRAVSDFLRNESPDGKKSTENSRRNGSFGIGTPQKRTLKGLTSRNNYDLWRTVARRRDSRKNNGEKNRSTISKDNSKCVGGRSRRSNEMLAKGGSKYGGNRGKKIVERLNDAYSSRDRQVFIDDYYDVEKNHAKAKSEGDKLDVGKVGVHRLIQNGRKNVREETMDDLFLRNETNGRDVDKQIEEKFARISNALREDAMEPRVIGDEIKDATDKVETSYEITRVEESSSEFNEFDFIYGRENGSTTRGFVTVKEIILGDERVEIDTTTLNSNFVSTEKPVKNFLQSNFTENLSFGTSDNELTLEGKDYDNNYNFTSTSSSSTSIGRPVLIVETLKISQPKFKQISDSYSQNLSNAIKTATKEPNFATTPPPIVIKCFKTTTSLIPRHLRPTTLRRISKSQSTLEEIKQTSTTMTFENLSMTKSMGEGVEKYAEITTTLSAIDLTENLASLSGGSTREGNETAESTTQTTRITDETFRASIKPLGEATGRTSPGAEFHDEIFIDDTTFPDETDAPTTTDQAKIREVFLHIEGDGVDSGIEESFDGDLGYNDGKGMKNIVPTKEKTEMNNEATIGEGFLNFCGNENDSGVEGDFGEQVDDGGGMEKIAPTKEKAEMNDKATIGEEFLKFYRDESDSGVEGGFGEQVDDGGGMKKIAPTKEKTGMNDKATIGEGFLKFYREENDSGVEGDFGEQVDDGGGMKKIVPTKEKTGMNDKATIGEEFFHFYREENDSGVEGDFGGRVDDGGGVKKIVPTKEKIGMNDKATIGEEFLKFYRDENDSGVEGGFGEQVDDGGGMEKIAPTKEKAEMNDKATIGEEFLKFYRDENDSGVEGGFGEQVDDGGGMEKIVPTKEKTEMNNEATIGEEFLKFYRDESDSGVEGDFGEPMDADNEETRETSGVKVGNNDSLFRKNVKDEDYSRGVDSNDSEFVFEAKNIDLMKKIDSKGSYMRENENYIELSMNEGDKAKEEPKDPSSSVFKPMEKYVEEGDFENSDKNNFKEGRTVVDFAVTSFPEGTTDFRKQRKESHPWFRTVKPGEFTLKGDLNFNRVSASKSPISSGRKTAKASKDRFSFGSSPNYETEEQTGRILPACGDRNNHKRSTLKKIIPIEYKTTGRRLLSIKKFKRAQKVHNRKATKKNNKNLNSSQDKVKFEENQSSDEKRVKRRKGKNMNSLENKVKFDENQITGEKRVKRRKYKNNSISKKRDIGISGAAIPREEAKDRRKKQSASEEDYFDDYDYLIPEELDGERIDERRAENIENPEDVFANFEMITASNEPLGANVDVESKMENTMDDLYNRNSPMAIGAEKFGESFKGDNSQPRSGEEKASRDSFRGDGNEGKDFEISLKGKVHLDADSNGRSMSINFDAVPKLLGKDDGVTNNGYVNQLPANSGIETSDTIAPEMENVNFLPSFNPAAESHALPVVQNFERNFEGSKIVGGEDLRKKESGISEKLLGVSKGLEEGGRISERQREFPNFQIYKRYDGSNRNTNRLNGYSKVAGNIDFIPEDAEADVDEEDEQLEDDSSNSESRDHAVKMSEGSDLRRKISQRSVNDLIAQRSVSFPDIFENLFTNEEPEDGSEISKNSKIVARDSNSGLKSGCYQMNSTVRKLHFPESTTTSEKSTETTLYTFLFSNRNNSNETSKESGVFNENIESTTVNDEKEWKETTNVKSTTIDYAKNLSESANRSSETAIKSTERKNALAIGEFMKKLQQLAKIAVNSPCTKNRTNDTVIHHERIIIVPSSRFSWTGKQHVDLHPSSNVKGRIKKHPKHLSTSNTSKGQLKNSKERKKSIISILKHPETSGSMEKSQENAHFESKLIKIMPPNGATSSPEVSKEATSSSNLEIPSSKESPCEIRVENEIRKSTGSNLRTGAENKREESLLFGKPEVEEVGSNIGAGRSSEEGFSGKKDSGERPVEARNVAKVAKEAFIGKGGRNNEKNVHRNFRKRESNGEPEDGSSGRSIRVPLAGRPQRGGVSKRVVSLTDKNSKGKEEERRMSEKSKGLKKKRFSGKSDSSGGKSVKLGGEEIREASRVGFHGDDRGRKERRALERKSSLLDGDPFDYLSPRKYRVDEEIRDGKGHVKGRRERRRSRRKKKRRKKKKKKGKRSAEGVNTWREWPLKRNLLMVFQEEDIPIATSRRTSKRDIPVEEFQRQLTKQREKKHEDSRNNGDIGKSGTRGGQNCMSRQQPSKVESPKYLESAHCLRFSDLWYSVYQLEEPRIDHEVYLQVYEKRSLPNGTISWMDLSVGSMIRLGTHDGYYKNHEDTIAITYNEGRLTSSRGYSLDSGRDRLLVPFSLTGNKFVSPEIQGWSDEYLVVDAEKINENGKECDKAGVSFAAFAGQPSRCERVRGSCLKNQPLAYWRHDTEARESGRGGCYFLSNFAPVPSEAIKYNVNGSGSREFLALEYHSPHVSVIDVELQADYNTPAGGGLSGCIAEVQVDNTALDYTIIMLVIINEGSTSSSYKPRIVDCPPGLPAAWRTAEGPAKLILPHRNRKVTLKLYGSLPIDEFYCTVNLVNQRGESVARRRIKVRKMDRCFCTWHCLCTCTSNDHRIACRPMSLENYYAAGFRGPIPVETFKSSTLSEPLGILLLFLVILLLLLLLMGLLKWTIGICVPSVSFWGLDVLLNGNGMRKCSEDSMSMEKDREIIRLCSRKLEFFLNLTFFLVYPFGICLRHCEKSPVSFGGRDTVESKMSPRSEGDDPPRMICVSTYGDSVNSTMEADDTRYVIEELKKSQDSLRTHSGSHVDHDRASMDLRIIPSTQMALLFQRIGREKTCSSSD